MDLHFIPECYIDTKLVKAFVKPITRYNHQKGCSTVVKVMQEKFTNDFAVGIVDRDKRELSYANEFNLVAEITDSLQLFKHNSKNHYLIFICPAMEKWIISSARKANISLQDFGLPNDFTLLKAITKTSKSEDNDQFSSNFKELFKALKTKNPSTVAILSFWIEYLKANPYTADLTYIKQQTNTILGL